MRRCGWKWLQGRGSGFQRGSGAGRAELRECFLDLGAQAFRFQDAGAKIGCDGEAGGCSAPMDLRALGLAEADGDTG